MSTHTETLVRFYAALSKADFDAVDKDFDADIERVEFEGSSSAGFFRGLAEVRAHIKKGRGTWAEGSCEPEHFLEKGETVVVDVYVRVRLKEPNEWISGRVADVFRFRNGKIVEFRTFAERADALKWAGIEE